MTSILSLLAGFLLGFGGPVTGLSIHPAEARTEVVIAMEGEAEFRDFTLEGPSRLVVDLLGARHALPGENFLDINRGGVRSIRASQYSTEIVRLVFELDALVAYQILPGEEELRVILVNAGESFEPWSTASLPSTAPEMPGVLDRVAQAQEELPPISVTFDNTPIANVLFTFAEYADRSIVPGAGVDVVISAEIRNQPWDVALEAILGAHGLVAREMETGIIRVDNLENLFQREVNEPVSTESFTINYATAADLESAVQAFLTPDRGRIATNPSTNTLIVTDVARVLTSVRTLIRELDKETPQVSISAKIQFVNRTDLNEFGVTYDLKDSQGNQLNLLTPGLADLDGDGIIELPDEQVDIGTDVISLGGSSLAALGNAKSRIPNSSMTILSSLVMGRHTLLSFIEALESVNYSEVVAEPYQQVLDNHTAYLQVGEDTPVRVIDAAAGGSGGGAFPRSQVEVRPTGIILEATPHVTASGKILIDLYAERSAVILAESDVGFITQTQNARTRVMVDDGETVAIGGLTLSESSEVRSGIPLLMDIPIIGGLFRVTRESTIQRDLIILVTPTIVRGGQN